ncbi:hypothetical protein GCM10011506_07300 [Marivirga lumbricoides]|uniref:DUF5018 domain-containing protein n=2 Tax=Marivirga lumbricoides TaxID=1046115 RepID=A0ABQ1LH50_9BACT|nr:hypothetical protein GCM10011506_07300 [Marivirga lumbricoides]
MLTGARFNLVKTKTENMRIKATLIIILSFTLLFSCEEGEEEGPLKKLTPLIKEFKFEVADNNNLSEDIYGTIDTEDKVINVIFPAHTSLIDLTPTISVPEGVVISPSSKVQQDFSKPNVYTLSGEGYITTEYTVNTSVKESEEADIISFNFLASNNAQLEENIMAVIQGKTIKAQTSDTTDLSALIPSIEISQGASISPAGDQAMDFTGEVKYTVTAQDATTKSEYIVQIDKLSSDKKIKSFKFNINDILYEAGIDYNNYEISLALPYNTDLSNLTPIIEIDEAASITPTTSNPQDFRNTIIYEVIAEDGSKQEYKVYVTVLSALENDRAVLEELYLANEDYNYSYTYLDWDLSADTMDDWQGVTISEGRVTELIISTVYINKIPNRIKELSELKSLTIVGTRLEELPVEVCYLEKLEALTLNDNNLSSIPAEIKNLKLVKRLHLQENNLDELPVEIGQMSKLQWLDVHDNYITALPVEIADIPNLLILNIKNNPLTSIPQVICDKKSEINNLRVVITKDDEDICN